VVPETKETVFVVVPKTQETVGVVDLLPHEVVDHHPQCDPFEYGGFNRPHLRGAITLPTHNSTPNSPNTMVTLVSIVDAEWRQSDALTAPTKDKRTSASVEMQMVPRLIHFIKSRSHFLNNTKLSLCPTGFYTPTFFPDGLLIPSQHSSFCSTDLTSVDGKTRGAAISRSRDRLDLTTDLYVGRSCVTCSSTTIHCWDRLSCNR
jgi:hypothetical protein